MQAIIAETKLELDCKSGHRLPIHVYIRAPYDLNDGSWGCYCNIAGMWDKEKRICGEDSFQALCLAIGFLRLQLQQMALRDATFYFPDENADVVPIDAIFGSMGVQR